MSGRYEIFDILAQDGDGVVFHAEDRQTGREVVLRRFFPFGASGGGLFDEERTAYEIAVRRLMAVSHPALRNVLDGGTDPVDGMPFIVTEWIEGRPLSEHLGNRPLSPPSAKALIDLALETCQVLSETFQEESVWIETSTDSIVLGPSEVERQVTFWISPLRWLGEANSRQGLKPILQLAEECTGWNRRMLSDATGDGLGGWIKALRKDPQVWTLEEARYALHHGPAAVSRTPQATPAANPGPISPAHATIPAQTTPPALRSSSTMPWWPWALAAVLSIAAIAFVFHQAGLFRPAPPEQAATVERKEILKTAATPAAPPAAPAEAPAGGSAADRASARAAELASQIEEIARLPEDGSAGQAPPELDDKLIEVGRQLRTKVGQSVTLEVRLYQVRASQSGKTLYLEFGSTREPDAICARYRTALGIFTEEELREHIGKVLRVRGPVVSDPSGRIAIDLDDEDDLTPEDA